MKQHTITILQAMLAAMEMREATGNRPENYEKNLAYAKAYREELVKRTRALSAVNGALRTMALRSEGTEFHESDVHRVVKTKTAHDDLVLLSRALDAVNDALETQDKREAETLHINQEAMQDIWNRAKNRAISILQAIEATNLVTGQVSPADVARQLKLRTDSLSSALQTFGAPLKHSQVLHVLGKMYGFKGYHALRAAVETMQPAFCPHCGSAGSVRKVGAPDAEATSSTYSCSVCSGSFSVKATAGKK